MPDITPEQKLDEIYRILKNQEKRRKTEFFYRIFKWIIIACLAFFVATNSAWILGKLTDMILPIVTENMKTMMQNTGSGFLDEMKSKLSESMQSPSSDR